MVLKDKLKELEAKSRFISEVLDDSVSLKQTENSLFVYFQQKKRGESYRYLTDRPVRNFTDDKYQFLLQQIASVKKEIDYVQKKHQSKCGYKS